MYIGTNDKLFFILDEFIKKKIKIISDMLMADINKQNKN